MPRVTGKSAAYPRGEGGNGLQHWSQSPPCNHITISRKPCSVAGELHLELRRPALEEIDRVDVNVEDLGYVVLCLDSLL